jgi:membrane-bound lytic murein transglycosylase D
MIRAGQHLNIWLLPSQGKARTVSQVKSVSQTSADVHVHQDALQNVISQSSSKTYVVQPGDTLWDISKRIGASIQRLKSLNNLKGSRLKPGMKLIVG